MTAVAKEFYLWVETGSMFPSIRIIVNPAELLFTSQHK